MQSHGTDTTNQLPIYHGLADAFGLESLMPYEEQQVSPLIMRATMYRFRHCLYFQTRLEESVIKQIRTLMKKNRCDEALNLVKERAQILHIPEEFLDSWELIPDRRLDPWRNYARRI